MADASGNRGALLATVIPVCGTSTVIVRVSYDIMNKVSYELGSYDTTIIS